MNGSVIYLASDFIFALNIMHFDGYDDDDA